MTADETKNRLVLWSQIKHFTPEEFDSPGELGSGLRMNIEFVKLLDQGREKTGFPWHINSGVRSELHNIEVGGKGPEHVEGLAADVRADAQQKFKILQWAYGVGIKRIGVGKDYIHLGFSFTLPQEVVWTYYP